jgi:hypothetical protein
MFRPLVSATILYNHNNINRKVYSGGSLRVTVKALKVHKLIIIPYKGIILRHTQWLLKLVKIQLQCNSNNPDAGYPDLQLSGTA